MNDVVRQNQEYLHLLDKAGNSGCYQWSAFFITILTYLVSGLFATNIVYLFMNNQFDCSHIQDHWTQKECEKYVCDHLSEQEISEFPIISHFQTIATQFGPFYCQQNVSLGFYRGFGFFGSFLGCLLVVVLSDNFSRKKTWAVSLFISILATFSLYYSSSILMAVESLFCIALGLGGLMRLSQVFLSEICEVKLKQRFVSSALAGFSIGEVLQGYCYSYFKEWRVCILFSLILLIILFLLVCFLLVDTPKFILQQPPDEAVRSLNWISRLNGTDPYEAEQLWQQMREEEEYESVKKLMTPLDLCRYSSLRQTFIFSILLWMVGDFIFMGHMTVIDHIGVNTSFNTLALAMGEILAIPLAICIIPHHERKKIIYTLLSIAFVISSAISFIKVPSICDFCLPGLFQIILTSLTRICIYFHFAVLHNLEIQFYPVSIRNIGMGVPTAFASLGSVACQITLTSAVEAGVNIYYIIMGALLLSALFMLGMPETYYMRDRNQVDEIQAELKLKKMSQLE